MKTLNDEFGELMTLDMWLEGAGKPLLDRAIKAPVTAVALR